MRCSKRASTHRECSAACIVRNDESVQEQQDEVEALLSIYTEEAVRIDAPPQKVGDPCAKFAVRIEDGVPENLLARFIYHFNTGVLPTIR